MPTSTGYRRYAVSESLLWELLSLNAQRHAKNTRRSFPGGERVRDTRRVSLRSLRHVRRRPVCVKSRLDRRNLRRGGASEDALHPSLRRALRTAWFK